MPAKTTARVIYTRVLWGAAATSWLASIVASIVLIALGVQLDATPILLWALIVVHLTVAAMIVSSMPNAEQIAARALVAAGVDIGDELAPRRA